jgi:hypothetical protein
MCIANRQKNIDMQFFLIEIEIKISLLTKSGPQEGIYIKLNIRGEISIIMMNKFAMTILEALQLRGLCKHIICNRLHLTITDDEYYKYF